MKILYYNWIQFDNPQHMGGGVNIYQNNLIEYLTSHTNNEIYFLSSGWFYNALKSSPYIRKTKNCFSPTCKSFEIINSPIMAPAAIIHTKINIYTNDTITYDLLDKFIQKNGPFDVIHFNNLEGISINVLKLKEKYPLTKFIVSIHNYQPICSLTQYFQNHNECICRNFHNGLECTKCFNGNINKKIYYKRCKAFYFHIYPKYKFISNILTTISKVMSYRYKKYINLNSTQNSEDYLHYRKHNIEYLNKYADTILAVSERVKQIMINNKIDNKKIKTSYIGTKIAEHAYNYSIAPKDQIFTIAYIGYARVDKGFFFLINALKQLDIETAKKINVVLAVKDLDHEQYSKELQNFNTLTIYDGYTHSELSSILKNVNLGIVPVLWEDNLPQVAIEMVALGVPILCSSFGGANELCKCDKFIFKGGDTTDFLKKLKTLEQNKNLLDLYWRNHTPLTTMQAHTQELMSLYNQQ